MMHVDGYSRLIESLLTYLERHGANVVKGLSLEDIQICFATMTNNDASASLSINLNQALTELLKPKSTTSNIEFSVILKLLNIKRGYN